AVLAVAGRCPAGAGRPGAAHDRVPGDRRAAEHPAIYLLPVLRTADGEQTMGERDRGKNDQPAESDVVAFSNGIRLTGRQWLGVGLFALALIILAPVLWKKVEPFDPGPDYRMPHELSNDYWLYERFADLAAGRYETVLIGDSVIWGEYVTRKDTLSHYL